MTEYLASAPVVVTQSLEEAREAVSRIYLRHNLASRDGALNMRFNATADNNMTLGYLALSWSTRTTFAAWGASRPSLQYIEADADSDLTPEILARAAGVSVRALHAAFQEQLGGTVLLPRDISYENAAPTLCAGYTVWAAIRRAAPTPGAHIAVVGIGGLGHFAIQYANAAGFGVTAVTRTASKADFARQLGADNVVSDGAELKAAGGADVIMHTSSSHAAVVNAMEGLRPWGKVIMNGIALDEMTLPPLPLVSHSYQIIGSAHNSLEYLAEALELVASGAVKPMIEIFPKERVADAYKRAASGAVRFKAVVTY